ncbi:MAG: oxygen-independent coproporphyrinogen III oxidase [Bacteroidota bacterium]
MIPNSLIQKYNIPGPRYTSYPTVPYWKKEGISPEKWMASVQQSFLESNQSEGISLYIHLPFCESLCTFCACHKRITKRHSVEAPYIQAVLREWDLYCRSFPEKVRIKELHLGGGTPTFFHPDNLEKLIKGITDKGIIDQKAEFSFEGHPNNTSRAHLQTLFNLGFRRTNFGVQDYDEKVQRTIHRIQPFRKVREVTEWAREIGFTSIGQDLVFGLPHQSKESIVQTIELTKTLQPDRIAYYSYAHVPWVKNVGQRGYNEKDLPNAEEKRSLYETGKSLLEASGYEEIGMDHFALTSDALSQSVKRKTLHRNFMGYTPHKTQLMIGLGMSSISDSWYGFAQNEKKLETYSELVNNGRLPIFRGHDLSAEDLIVRKHILNIMCHFETSWATDALRFPELENCLERLEEMERDGLVDIYSNGLSVPEHARPFVRNICMAFDLHLNRNKPQTRVFSMTV